MKFINGKSEIGSENTGGIGIENVRRRLELLYPDTYRLDIISEEDVYIVILEITTHPNAAL